MTTESRVVRLRLALCLAGLVVLIAWQLVLIRMPWPETYEFHASSGLAEQDKFVYSLYYTNNFPIASTKNGLNYFFYYTKAPVAAQANTLEYSMAGAQRLFREQAQTLVMEWGHTIRSGQLFSTYLFLPDAWRLGSPQFAEVRVTNGAMFIAALASVYLMGWWAGRPVFGVVFVLLIGSNPFQLYEAYRHENVFSWPITAFCFMLALALPFLTGKHLSVWYAGAAAIVAGLFVATVRQIRPEPFLTIAAVAMAMLWATSLTWRARLLAVAVLAGATLFGIRAWDAYFDRKFEQAARVVASAGGHVLSDTPGHYHVFWHPIWCGLGDFDTTHGHKWDDSAAAAYAQPVLKARYNQDLPWWWGVETENVERTASDYLDPDHLYYRTPYFEPHYDEVLREKVLSDIRQDPAWFAGILGRRLARVFTETTRPQITLSTTLAASTPFPALLVLPLALAGAFLRRWTALKILAFSFVTSLPALLVYSGRGMTDYSVFHLCALALVADALVDYGKHRLV
jgi:hypothetical protein